MVLKKYEEQFHNVVEVKEIVHGLHRKEVISRRVLNQVEEISDKQARELLFDHLMKHGDMDSVKAFCKEAISTTGYPHMKNLGKEMLAMLEQEEG